jgi:hypothetical protein
MKSLVNQRTMLLAPLLLYFFVSKEFIGIRLFMTKHSHDLLMMFIVVVILIVCSPDIIQSKKRKLSLSRLDPLERKYYYLLIIYIIFLIVHEVVIGDRLRSIKYSIFMMILIWIWLNKAVNIAFIARLYICFVTILFLMGLFGLFLTFYMGIDLPELPPVIAMETTFNRKTLYVNPFGLGLLRPWSKVFYGDFIFPRVNSYTPEAKYAVTLVLVLMVNIIAFVRHRLIRNVLLLFSVVTLFFVHSYTGFATLLLAYCLYLINTKCRVSPKIQTLFLLSMAWIIIGSTWLMHDKYPHVDNYFMNRIRSGAFISGSQVTKPSVTMIIPRSLIGTSGDSRLKVDYGILGFFLKWALFSVYACLCFKFVHKTNSKSHQFALILAVVSYYMFWMYFLNEFITPSAVLLILSTFSMVDNIHLKENLPSVNRLVS